MHKEGVARAHLADDVGGEQWHLRRLNTIMRIDPTSTEVAGDVFVTAQPADVVEPGGVGHHVVSAPKSAASRRSVALPGVVAAALEEHLSAYADPGPEGLLFPAPEGGFLRLENFRRRVWTPANRRRQRRPPPTARLAAHLRLLDHRRRRRRQGPPAHARPRVSSPHPRPLRSPLAGSSPERRRPPRRDGPGRDTHSIRTPNSGSPRQGLALASAERRESTQESRRARSLHTRPDQLAFDRPQIIGNYDNSAGETKPPLLSPLECVRR